MFINAYMEDCERVAYFDVAGNKFIVKGGTLAWRINNPGLVPSRSPIAKRHGSIGSCGKYAIFAVAEQGHRALISWLRLRKYFNSKLKTIAKYYQPNDVDGFLLQLHSLANLPSHEKINALSVNDFASLLRAVEKLCGFAVIGGEELSLLPKINGKIEHSEGQEDSYLIGNDIILSKTETIAWIQSGRCDALIIHESNGNTYLRSRPHHSFWHIRTSPFTGNPLPQDAPVATMARTVGKNKPGQCIWAFINGISNTKEQALHYAEIISSSTGGEAVISLPNDTQWLVDILTCLALKGTIDTPVVMLAANFFRYLLALSREATPNRPVIIFVHSQGAIICEHALKHLSLSERSDLVIFSIGGGALIAPGQSHPDSHNYASAADPIFRLGSQYCILALERYVALKRGISCSKLIQDLAMNDALLQIDSLNPEVINTYAHERVRYYERQFEKISNVTVLDPDPGHSVQHGFQIKCYQAVIRDIIKRYQLSGR